MSSVPAHLAPRIETRLQRRARMLREAAALQAARDRAGGRPGAAASSRALAAAAIVAVLALALGGALFEGVAGQASSVAPARRAGGFSHEGLLSLPLAAQAPVSAAMGADGAAYRVSASKGGFAAASPAQRLSLRFGRSGVSVSSGATRVGLSLQAVGYGTSLTALGGVAPRASGNRVSYERAGLSEWYVSGPLGLEQGFTIQRAPAGRPVGPLSLSVALSGDVHASLAADGRSITFSRTGGPSLRYSGLRATDAHGRVLRSWLQLGAGRLLLRVDTRGARYPLRIDPFVQQGEKLTAGDEIGQAFFGWSVALSSDGNTALIGGPNDNNFVGAVWVFVRAGSTWTQQVRLTGSSEQGQAEFGVSVALSADGNTALVGSHNDGAWVFTRSGDEWTEQRVGVGGSGESVALSADGDTALVEDVSGAAVDTRTGGEWIGNVAKLTTVSGEIGSSVALSADGNTALVGNRGDNEGVGAAWVFARSGTTWSQQGEKLTGSGEVGQGWFGASVALSSNGNTALVGGPLDNGSAGAVWVLARSGEEWIQQSNKLTGEHRGLFGASVALSADGKTGLISAPYESLPGAAYLFEYSGTGWVQHGHTFTGSGSAGLPVFGDSVALSADGSTALIGGYNDSGGLGAAWAFANESAPPLVVTGVASSVTQTSAGLNGTVNPNGGLVSDCHFEYGTSASYGASVSCASLPGSGESLVAVSAVVEGLRANTVYHFRIVATNPTATSYGSDQTFTTISNPPLVVTGVASSVTQTSAGLNGTVNPNGGLVSDCHFEYGTSASYGASVSCASLPGSGDIPVAVSAVVEGLRANTVYHFRIVAANSGGVSYGSDQPFRTRAQEAEYGTCIAQNTGYYSDGNCLGRHAKGKKGTYEWKPGPAPTCASVKKGFYAEAKCKMRDEEKGKPKGKYERQPGPGYTSTSGTATLAVPGLDGSTIVCAASTGEGEITNVETGVERVVFTGCEMSGKACTSQGSDSTPSGMPGVIVTNLLDTELLGPVAGNTWTEFVSSEHEPYLFEFDCEGRLFRTIGSLAGVQTGNVDVSSLTSTTTFVIGQGEQALYAELSETGGISWLGPDPCSLVTAASNTSASPTEIKTGL